MKFDAVDRHGDISGELTDSPSSYPKFRLIALHKNRRGTSPPLRLLPEEPSSQQLPTHRNEARTLDPGRRCTSCTCHRRHIFPYESDSSSSSERTLPLRVVRVGEREGGAISEHSVPFAWQDGVGTTRVVNEGDMARKRGAEANSRVKELVSLGHRAPGVGGNILMAAGAHPHRPPSGTDGRSVGGGGPAACADWPNYPTASLNVALFSSRINVIKSRPPRTPLGDRKGGCCLLPLLLPAPPPLRERLRRNSPRYSPW